MAVSDGVVTFRGMGWFRLTRSGFVPIDLNGRWLAPPIIMRDWRVLQVSSRIP